MSKSKDGDKSKKLKIGKRNADESANYKVGKGKPPLETQFKPGQSGNPNGRPKGSMNIKKIIYEMGSLDMDIMGPDGVQTVTRNEALSHKLWNMALSGNFPALKYLNEINQERYAKRKEGRMTQQEFVMQRAHILAEMILSNRSDSDIDIDIEAVLDDPGLGRTVVPNDFKDEDEDDEPSNNEKP